MNQREDDGLPFRSSSFADKLFRAPGVFEFTPTEYRFKGFPGRFLPPFEPPKNSMKTSMFAGDFFVADVPVVIRRESDLLSLINRK